MIKTWQQRCEEHPDHQQGIVTQQMIQDRMQEEIDELRQALAQPEQEPVAWSDVVSNGGLDPRNAFDTASPCQTGSQCIGGKCPECGREWVGLTDEDLKPLCDEWKIMYGGYVDAFAKTIEAKLKEKNGG